MSQLAWP